MSSPSETQVKKEEPSEDNKVEQVEKEKKDRIVIYKVYWTTRDVENHPDWLYVYGDNDIKKGKGGQAIIRDLENTHGIPTKRFPSMSDNSYYSDLDYERQCRCISAAFDTLITRARDYACVVFSGDGLGTGLSELPTRAPLTAKFLSMEMARAAKIIRAQ